MTRKRWTQEEIDLLSKNSNENEEVLLKLLPNRTFKSIKHKIENSGFHRDKAFKLYTKEEDEILSLYSTDSQERLLELLPNRTWESIAYRIEVLKLPRAKAWELWSKEEEDVILKYETIKEMSEHLPNRTESKIYSKAIKMGKIFNENFWSEDDVEYLVNNYTSLSPAKIADKLNRSIISIYQKANDLKLKSSKYRIELNQDEVLKMYLEDNMMICEIAELLNVGTAIVSRTIPDNLKRHVYNLDEEYVIREYLSGRSAYSISKEYDFSAATILTLLKNNNIAIREYTYYFHTFIKELPVKEIIDLYKYGFSSVEIGEIYGVVGETIIKRLKENNVPIRKDNSFYISGSKSSSWKGGITNPNVLARGKKEYHHWRFSVYERDNYTCQCCGDSIGGNLHAHHIDNFSDNEELRFELSNGISMCASCHISQIRGSFHHTYGTHNNDIYQLQEYFDDVRSELGLPMVKIEDIVFQKKAS